MVVVARVSTEGERVKEMERGKGGGEREITGGEMTRRDRGVEERKRER